MLFSSSRPLQGGDLISVDVSVYLNRFHGDTCLTFVVPPDPDASSPSDDDDEIAPEELRQFVQSARDCLDAGVAVCGPGVPFKEIATAIGYLYIYFL